MRKITEGNENINWSLIARLAGQARSYFHTFNIATNKEKVMEANMYIDVIKNAYKRLGEIFEK